jgi:hypothetical protein
MQNDKSNWKAIFWCVFWDQVQVLLCYLGHGAGEDGVVCLKLVILFI